MVDIVGITSPLPEEAPSEAHVRSFLMQNAQIGIPLRYRRLDRLDAFYNCLEYAHLEHDWNGVRSFSTESIAPEAAAIDPAMPENPDDTVPLSRRRPSAPMHLTPSIVDRFTSMLFAEGRSPEISVEGDPDADDFINAVFKDANFETVMRSARTYGGAMGSSLVTFKVNDGRFVLRAHKTKYVADVIWADRDRLIPEGVLIQYLTLREFEELTEKGEPTGKVRSIPYVYRRIIDPEWDIVFKEAPLGEDGRPPAMMEVDERQSTHHKIGKFPGVWIQNLHDTDDIDGISDCDGAFQMMEEADRLNAQANRSLKYNMDPTLVTARQEGAAEPIEKGAGVGIEVGPNGSATYLEISGAGITAAFSQVDKLRLAVLSKTQCVLPDPSAPAAAATSGKQLELAYQPMIEKAGALRAQYGQAIVQLGDLILHAARIWSDPLMYEGNSQPKWTLPMRIEERDPDPNNPDVPPKVITTVRTPGKGGQLSLAWGAYFAMTHTDRQMIVATLANARMSKLIDVETAVDRIAEVFDVENKALLLRKVLEEIESASANPGFGGEGDGLLEDEDPFAMNEPDPTEPPGNAPPGTPGGFQ